MRTLSSIAIIILTLALATTRSFAVPETCGDGIDNNGNSMADDGCWPNGALNGGNFCESPMPCNTTGDIAPKTGNIVYKLPPDLSPAVPFGPSLVFSRT